MQVNLYVSGRKLKDLDTFSKSDPQCILFEKRNNHWIQIGQTEQINNTLNPDFKTGFTLGYFFEKVQNFKFVLIDGDGGGDYDTIGEIEVTMGKLMGAKKQIFTGDLTHQGQGRRGQIIIRAQAVQQTNEVIKMGMNWRNINNGVPACMGMCPSPADYHLEIMKQVAGTEQFVIARRVGGNYRRDQRQISIPAQIFPIAQICDGNKDSRVKFVLVADTDSPNRVELHSCETTIK